MGVDTNLYLSAQIEPEAIAFALAKAMGEQPQKVQGKDNIFSGEDYIKTCDFAPASMWYIEIPKHDDMPHCQPRLHRSNDNALGPCWLLIARAHAEVIAIFRTVAEALGGVLVWNDCDDYGRYYHGPEDYGFTRVCDATYAIERAHITQEDIEKAAY